MPTILLRAKLTEWKQILSFTGKRLKSQVSSKVTKNYQPHAKPKHKNLAKHLEKWQSQLLEKKGLLLRPGVCIPTHPLKLFREQKWSHCKENEVETSGVQNFHGSVILGPTKSPEENDTEIPAFNMVTYMLWSRCTYSTLLYREGVANIFYFLFI
jgi:hypothetical protein